MSRLAFNLLVPHTVTVLGELGECVVERPDGVPYALPYKPGSILCAAHAEGEKYAREMFIFKPEQKKRGRFRSDAVALRAINLHKRFMHRDNASPFNLVVKPIRPPRYFGELAIVRYIAEKEMPGTPAGPVEYEHYFEEPGVAPAYAAVYALGGGQFYIPRGPYRVEAPGIEFHRDTTPGG